MTSRGIWMDEMFYAKQKPTKTNKFPIKLVNCRKKSSFIVINTKISVSKYVNLDVYFYILH